MKRNFRMINDTKAKIDDVSNIARENIHNIKL